MHLIIDGYSSNPEILQDEDFLRQLLEDIPAQINMTRISPPYVLKYDGVKPEDSGISGFVFIAESHISVHSFIEKNYVNIDVFSCKDFDAGAAIKSLRDKFQLDRLRTCLIGREWPAESPSPAGSTNISYHEE